MEGDFDLLLLDLLLPRLHGHEVCQQLRMNKVIPSSSHCPRQSDTIEGCG
jgi:DNA-binding response OmpR family regulator